MTLADSVPFDSCGPGAGRLEVRRVDGCSAVTAVRSRSPLRLLTPRPRGMSAWAFLSSFGGGMVAGDETSLKITIGPGARCFVGTQSSTKIYRNPLRRPCNHSVHATVDVDGLLVLLPEPVQAFADSSYEQMQTVQLSEGAGLVLLDWCSAGRSARGERWAFRRIRSRTEVYQARELAVMDSLLLDSSRPGARQTAGLTGVNCLGVLILLGAPMRALARRVVDAVRSSPIKRGGALLVSASPLRDGAIIRVAAEETEQAGAWIRSWLTDLADLLGDDPFSRKW